MLTPTTSRGLRQYDQLDPTSAVVEAWRNAGSVPEWHYEMQDRLRQQMPLLARALDRLVYGDRMVKPPIS